MHMPQDDERARRIRLEGRAPIGKRRRVQRLDEDTADGMNDGVDGADVRLHAFNERAEPRIVEHVSGIGSGADPGRGRGQPFAFTRNEHGPVAVCRNPARDLRTDAARPAGNEDDFVHPPLDRPAPERVRSGTRYSAARKLATYA